MRIFLIYFTILLSLLNNPVFSCDSFEEVQELFGEVSSPHPLVYELLQSPVMERIKGVDQLGISHYFWNLPSFTRYEHSIGVYIILERFGAPLDECIAGLLHDTSHTVFSHVGDFLFEKDTTVSHQDKIHNWYLEQQGVEKILEKWNLSIEAVDPKSGKFLALEQELPNMCADRIEYNLHKAYALGLITREDIHFVLGDLCFEGGKWFFKSYKAARYLADLSNYFTAAIYATPENLLCYHFFAKALQRAIKIGIVTVEEIYFSTDQNVLSKVLVSEDPQIDLLIKISKDPFEYYEFCNSVESELFLKSKMRGIDPLIIQNGELVRLTSIDSKFAEKRLQIAHAAENGYHFKAKDMDAQPSRECVDQPEFCLETQ